MKLLAIALLTVSAAAADAARDTAWRQDLDTLATELPRRHPNLYANVSRAVFDEAVADLRAAIPSLNEAEVMVGLARLAALPRDGHTNLWLTQRNSAFRLLPLRLRWFDDGLFVVSTGAGYERAAATKVLRIGGVPVDDLYPSVAAMISHENDSWARETSPDYLVNNDILAALKLAADNRSTTFDLQDLSGAVFSLDVASAPAGPLAPVTAYPDPAAGYTPLWQRHRELNYWYTYIESSRTVYFAYNQCADIPGQPFATFNAQFWALFDSIPVERFIIDLRNNTGGNSAILAPFFYSASARMQAAGQVKAYVIIGRRSYSSAVFNAIDLHQGPVRLIGQPSGGNPNGFGEVQSITLPNSRLAANVSTRLFWNPLVPMGPLVPDVTVSSTSADYFARHDPFLAAVLADAGQSPPSTPSDVTVVNAASFRRGAVAAGSLASAFGGWDGATEVMVNGQTLPLIGAAPGQVNFLVPAGTASGSAAIRVQKNGAAVASGVFDVAAVAPGLFVSDARDPARPGAVVAHGAAFELYATGQGASTEAPRVYVGADRAIVTYSGAHPSFPGLWQINIAIPDSVAAGQVPVFVVAANAASNGVTVQIGK